MALTDTAIRNAKSFGKTVKLSDGEGLQLWITLTGSKLWRLAYRLDGKPRKLSIGAYPTIDLKTARQKREEAKQILRDGRDPSAQKKVAKLSEAAACNLRHPRGYADRGQGEGGEGGADGQQGSLAAEPGPPRSRQAPDRRDHQHRDPGRPSEVGK